MKVYLLMRTYDNEVDVFHAVEGVYQFFEGALKEQDRLNDYFRYNDAVNYYIETRELR